MHNGRAFQMESLLVGCFWFECVIRSTAMFPWIILSCNLRQNYKQFFLKIERKTIKHVNVNIFYITRSTQIDKILIGKTDLLLKVKFSLALFPMKSVWNVPGKASALVARGCCPCSNGIAVQYPSGSHSAACRKFGSSGIGRPAFGLVAH